jgi:hypothetical protein
MGEIVVDWRGKLIYCQNKHLFALAMRQFERDLLDSIRQARRGEGRVTKINITKPDGIRKKACQDETEVVNSVKASTPTLDNRKNNREKVTTVSHS